MVLVHFIIQDSAVLEENDSELLAQLEEPIQCNTLSRREGTWVCLPLELQLRYERKHFVYESLGRNMNGPPDNRNWLIGVKLGRVASQMPDHVHWGAS